MGSDFDLKANTAHPTANMTPMSAKTTMITLLLPESESEGGEGGEGAVEVTVGLCTVICAAVGALTVVPRAILAVTKLETRVFAFKLLACEVAWGACAIATWATKLTVMPVLLARDEDTVQPER